MDLRSEVEKSIDLLKAGGNGAPSKAHRNLLHAIWKGDQEDIEAAIALIQRAEVFAKIQLGKCEQYSERMVHYWRKAEEEGRLHNDCLGSER